MFQQGRIAHMDLLLLQNSRDRHHQRELLHLALEVIRHRDHGLVVVPRDGHLGGLVEQFRIGLTNIEPAES